MRVLLLLSACLVAAGCNGTSNTTNPNIASTTNRNIAVNSAAPSVVNYTYEIVKVHPHDPKAFTQGLIYHNGSLYEGTGGSRYSPVSSPSSLRQVVIETGRVLRKHELAPEYFGEGIALLGDKIYQLTWREQKAFVYNLADFKLLQEFSYSGEGWGLTEDGTNLYMSDGTHVIRIVDPETFRTIRTVVVMDERGKPIMKLNELEWVKGEIWANVW
ncbi:MAG: glutaminyl-peptide cyclotransferase, partial [Acidobacteria bacterium]|nr:glutaminyl-peptide cyclotransferase [Acidobacteriota bacterium]